MYDLTHITLQVQENLVIQVTLDLLEVLSVKLLDKADSVLVHLAVTVIAAAQVARV